MPSLRLNRNLSRNSTPSLAPSRDTSSPAEDPRKENRSQTFLDKWVEPPVKTPLASFEDHGFQRGGLFAQMAPLGQMPNTKLKIRVSAGGHVRKKSGLSRGEVVSAMETPLETPEDTPPVATTPVATTEEDTDEVGVTAVQSKEQDDDDDEEYVPKGSIILTPRARPVLNGPSPRLRSTPKQSRRGSPTLKTPHTAQALDSIRSSKMSTATRASYNRDEWDGIVQGVVAAATRADKPKVGEVTSMLCQEYQRDPQVAEVLDAILTQSATQEQYDLFKTIYRQTRRRMKEFHRSARRIPRLPSLNGTTPSMDPVNGAALLPGFSPPPSIPSTVVNNHHNAVMSSPNRANSRSRHVFRSSPVAAGVSQSAPSSRHRSRTSLPSEHTKLQRFASNPGSPSDRDEMKLRNRQHMDTTPVPGSRGRKAPSSAPVEDEQTIKLELPTLPEPSNINIAGDSIPSDAPTADQTVTTPSLMPANEITAAGSRPRRGGPNAEPIDYSIPPAPWATKKTPAVKVKKPSAKASAVPALAKVADFPSLPRRDTDGDDDPLSDIDESFIEEVETERAEVANPKDSRKRSAAELYIDASEDQTNRVNKTKRAKTKKDAVRAAELALQNITPVTAEQLERQNQFDQKLKINLRLQFRATASSSSRSQVESTNDLDGDLDSNVRYDEMHRPNARAPSPLRRLDDDAEYDLISPGTRLPLIVGDSVAPKQATPVNIEDNTIVRRSTRDPLAPVKKLRAANEKATTKTSPVRRDGTTRVMYAGMAPGANNQVGSDNMHEACDACGGLGELVVCEGCPRAFHYLCVDPPADADDQDFRNKAFHCAICEDDAQMSRAPALTQSEIDSDIDDNEAPLGAMSAIEKTLKRTNPAAFALPKDIKQHFMGVEQTRDGRYKFHTDKAVPLRTQRRGSAARKSAAEGGGGTTSAGETDREGAAPESRSWICTTCGNNDNKGRRPMIQCDWANCHNKIHIDHSTKNFHGDYNLPDKGPHRWPAFCEQHLGYAVGGGGEPLNMIEVNGEIRQVHPVRMLKKGVTMSSEEAKLLNYRNNGNISLELDEAEDDTVRRLNGKTVAVPEKAIIDNFMAKVRNSGQVRAQAITAERQAYTLFKHAYQDKVHAEFERRVQLEVERRMILERANIREYVRDVMGRSQAEQEAIRALHEMSGEQVFPKKISGTAIGVEPLAPLPSTREDLAVPTEKSKGSQPEILTGTATTEAQKPPVSAINGVPAKSNGKAVASSLATTETIASSPPQITDLPAPSRQNQTPARPSSAPQVQPPTETPINTSKRERESRLLKRKRPQEFEEDNTATPPPPSSSAVNATPGAATAESASKPARAKRIMAMDLAAITDVHSRLKKKPLVATNGSGSDSSALAAAAASASAPGSTNVSPGGKVNGLVGGEEGAGDEGGKRRTRSTLGAERKK